MRTQIRDRVVMVAIVCAMAMGAQACRASMGPAQTAHHAANVVAAANQLQKWVTASTDQGALPVNVGRAITDANQEVKNIGDALLAALRVVDATQNTDMRAIELSKAHDLLTELNTKINVLLKIDTPPNAATEFAKLVAGISKAYDEARQALGS